MTDVTIIVGDKSTYQILDQDSGVGEVNPDRIYVPLTGDFSPGDQVWVSDDDSAELGTIQAIVADDYLDMTVNLTGLYTVAKNAKVCLVNNISNDVIDADTWRDRLTCIGRCKLRLENYGRTDRWGNTFASNDPIVVSINGTVVWQGFVDDVKPVLTVRGVINNEVFLNGRDHGRYLTDYNFTKKYKEGWAADIVDDILSILGDPLLYTDDGQYGGEVKIKYEGIRTDLGDALRDICELSGRDFYINNNGRLYLFKAGDVDSTEDLDMVFGNAANNLLTFEEYEQVGFSIKNYIEIHAGSVKDHWTDETANSFSVEGAGAARSDEYTHYIFGTSSVELAANGAISRIYLDFSGGLFSYSPVINLSKPCEAKVFIKGEITGLDEFNLRPYLIDSSARRITFKREGPTIWTGAKGNPKGWTDGIVDWNVRNVWSALSYPLGASDGNPIKAAETDKFWYGDTAFDWANVEIIGFEYQHVANGVVWIDGWCIPSVDARAIHEDVASQDPLTGHGIRMYSELRNDMKSQKQLEDYAAALLSLRKDPIQKFKGVAHGQVGTKYAAQTVNVNVPDYDLNDDPYTITLLHHKIHHNKDIRGWDFLTEYELCAQDAPATIIIRDDNPMEILMDKLRRENRGFKGAMEADDILLGDVVSGNFMDAPRGIAFPATPANGDMFWLTADYDDAVNQYYGTASGLLYTFDDAIPKWVRGPANLGQRAGDPPAGSGGGEYVGDTYLNTTDSITYQWDGAAWTQTAQPTIADATDFATVEWPTDQMAIELRKWTSDFSITWDEADYNDVDWGQIGDEGAGGTDATISYASGLPASVDVDCGSAADLADGTWYFYWDVANMAAGDYVLQRTQNYSLASGVGKGLMAIAEIDNATPKAPTFIMLNSYIPVIGAGAITAHAIWSKHISADWITGKNFQTALNVGTGVAGIRIDSVSIRGYDAVNPGNLQFYLQAADGKAYCGAGAVILDANGITVDGQAIYFNDAGSVFRGFIMGWAGANPYLQVGATEDLWLTSGAGDDIFIIPGGGATYTRLYGIVVPSADGAVNLGTAALPFGETVANHHRIRTTLADNTASGIIRQITAGENLTIGEALYMKNDGKYWLAKADAEATMPCTCLALESIAADATGDALFFGPMKDADVFAGLVTEGAMVFVSENVAGAFTETIPNGSGEIVQVVGEVKANNEAFFTFDNTYLELA